MPLSHIVISFLLSLPPFASLERKKKKEREKREEEKRKKEIR